MGLEVGIVGLPNVGKSTLFQCITSAQAEVANYPFCTIEPNVGIAEVPDTRLKRLKTIFSSGKCIPNILKMTDIAGLVEGASKGEGLGNKFLDNIRKTDVIAHVVRCFDDPNIVHVRGTVSPRDDINIIHGELLLADIEAVERRYERTLKLAKGNRRYADCAEQLKKLSDSLQNNIFASAFEYPDSFADELKELNLLTMKPFFFVMNVSEEDLSTDSSFQKEVKTFADKHRVNCIKICCSVESELSGMAHDEKAEFLADLGIEEPGLQAVIREGFSLLDQITFFTAGKKEIRAWNVKKKSKCPQAAGKIHTDMERGFIRSEVYHFDDIDTLESEVAVRESGKLRVEGKDYVVVDGDILNIRFNV